MRTRFSLVQRSEFVWTFQPSLTSPNSENWRKPSSFPDDAMDVDSPHICTMNFLQIAADMKCFSFGHD